jgi:hypothetical protein
MTGPAGPGDSDVAEGDSDTGVEGSMAGFRRRPDGVSARFTAAQAGIIRNLVGQVADLIEGQRTGEQGTMPDAGAEGPTPGTVPPMGEAAGPGAPFGMEDLAAMLGEDGPTDPPDDPVLARLLPDAYRDDPAAAGEFRRFTEAGLRSAKVEAARRVLGTLPERGGRVRLSDSDAQAWLRSLNDVRLALGVRLGITEDYGQSMARVSRDDPAAAYLWVYDWLSVLLETLVRALS